METYKLITNGNFLNLQEDINRHLRDGWELVGGVSLCQLIENHEGQVISAGIACAQALVKKS